MNLHGYSRYLVAALSLALGVLAAGTASRGENSAEYTAIVVPWRDVTLGFVQPGKISAMPADLGQMVARGQVIARQDDSKAKLALQMTALKADNKLDVQAAAAELADQKVKLKRVRWAAARRAATAFELQRAKLKCTIDRLSLKLAHIKHAGAQLQYQLAQLEVRRRSIQAPFAGLVEKRYVHVGEGVQAFDKVIRLVRINPLKAFVPLPLAVGMTLHSGMKAKVRFPDGTQTTGMVTWVAGVADPASQTLQVRVKIPNPRHEPADQQVRIMFSSEAMASGRR